VIRQDPLPDERIEDIESLAGERAAEIVVVKPPAPGPHP
jgi:hypothetical protein